MTPHYSSPFHEAGDFASLQLSEVSRTRSLQRGSVDCAPAQSHPVGRTLPELKEHGHPDHVEGGDGRVPRHEVLGPEVIQERHESGRQEEQGEEANEPEVNRDFIAEIVPNAICA